MTKRYRGLASVLFVVVAIAVGGCSGRRASYTAGLTAGDAVEKSGALPDERQAAGSMDGLNGKRDAGAAADPFGTGGDAPAVAGEASGNDAGAPALQRESEALICVHVCGAVNAPDVYEMAEGSRVCDAVALAGGFAEDADSTWINQAGYVQDGQQLYVYTAEETQGLSRDAPPHGEAAVQDTADGLVNLNTAGREELMTLPGIGEAKADAIIAWRTEHGAFGAIEEIQQISGIKEAVFSKIKDRITV